MGKGLPRSMSRGAPQRQEIVKQTYLVRNLTITVDATTGNGFGTVVIGDFPEGNLLYLGGVSYLTFAGSGSDADLSDTWNGDYSIGTTPSADATLTGTDANLIDSAAIGPAVAEVSPRTRSAGATQAMLDNTDGSLEINLNLSIDDADIAGTDSVITINGEVQLLFSVMMDD